MDKNYENEILLIRNMEKAIDPNLIDQLCEAVESFQKYRIKTVAAVSMYPGSRTAELVAGITAETFPSWMTGRPSVLTLQYGEEAGLYSISESGYFPAEATEKHLEKGRIPELVYEMKEERFRDRQLILCNGVMEPDVWPKILMQADAVVLYLNGTAAMNQNEKTFLQDILIPLFGKKHIAVYIDHMKNLNSDEDRNAVLELVHDTGRNLGARLEVLYDPADLQPWIEQEMDRETLMEEAKERFVRINLLELMKKTDEILQRDSASIKDVKGVIQKLESQQEYLELAGQAAAEISVVNQYDIISSELKEGVRDFNEQSCADICRQIDSADPKDLETLEPKIRQHLIRIWEYYQEQVNEVLKKKQAKCYEILSRTIEKDAGTLYENLDDETIQLIGDLLEKASGIDIEFHEQSQWGYAGNNKMARLKSETRNMMLLSIPLVFINVSLAVAGVVGVKIFEKVKESQIKEDNRKEIKQQVRESCEEISTCLCREIDSRFAESQERSSQLVKKAYGSIVDILVCQLKEYQDGLNRMADRNDHLKVLRGEAEAALKEL